MNILKRLLPLLTLTVFFVFTCSKNNSTESLPVNGKITASATGIAGQNGNIYAVSAFDSDWFPGSNSPTIAGIMGTITSDNYSFTQNLKAVDDQALGGLSADDMVFEPKTYSVVFFVAAPGNPPQHFAEVRMEVNGDVTATAPDWASWAHPQ